MATKRKATSVVRKKRGASGVRLLVGTKKGAFVLTSDGARKQWEVSGPHFAGWERADSVVVDPHKWLYAPLEAGCVLVRDRQQLKDAFSHHVSYYRFGSQEEDPPTNYFEYGPQNSRGFRALKVWLALRHAGREGYERMISDDIALAREMYRIASGTPELEVFTNALSITTFRYVPDGLRLKGTEREEYLNNLNESLLVRLQNSGEAYLSNAVIRGSFVLRACIVNFRTSMKEIAALPPLVVRLGKELHREMIQQHQL